MTTASYTPETSRSTYATATRSSAEGASLGFDGILTSERIKLTSLRSFRLTLLVTLILGAGFSFLAAFAWTSSMGWDGTDIASLPGEALQPFLLMVISFASPFLALIFGVLGVFAISSEYSSGMILSTLAAVPKRTPVFVAKAVILAAFAGLTALALTVIGFIIAVLFVPNAASEIFSSVVVSGALGTIAYLVLIALLGFGIAAILRSTAGGIALVAGITFVLPLGFQFLSLTDWEWVPTVSNYLPMSLGTVLSNGITEQVIEPGYWVSLLALAIWALVPMVLGNAMFKGRDAK